MENEFKLTNVKINVDQQFIHEPSIYCVGNPYNKKLNESIKRLVNLSINQ